MTGTVTIQSALFEDPRYQELTPSQRASLPLLVRLVEQFGTDGILDLQRKTVWRNIGLGPKTYEDLIVKMDLWGWGCETEQGRLMLCGPLAPVSSPAALLSGSGGGDLQQVIAQAVAAAVAAAMPVAIAAAIPSAIRQHQAEAKQHQRANKQQGAPSDVLDKAEPEAANVQDKEAEADGDVPDTEPPSRTGAQSNESIDIESSKSYSSNSNDSILIDAEDTAATLPPKVLPADVVQMLVEKSIAKDRTGKMKRERAEAWIIKPGPVRCLEVLLMLAALPIQPDRPGGWINSKLGDLELEVPAKITAEAKRLLSPSMPKPHPRPAPPPAPKPPPSEEERIKARVWSFEHVVTPDQMQQITAEAIGRMKEPHRAEYQRAVATGEKPGTFAGAEYDVAYTAVFREWALRDSGSANAPQGG